MTRFARAKGSKSSNERVPEEATPWNQMKQQFLEKSKYVAESKNRQEAIDQRNANYKAFIEEKELEESKKSQWAQFPSNEKQHTSASLKTKKKNLISLVNENSDDLSDNDETFVALKAKVDKALSKTEKSKISDANSDSDTLPEELSSKLRIYDSSPKIKKVKKKKITTSINITTSNDMNNRGIEIQLKKRKNEDDNNNKQSKKIKSSEREDNLSSETKINQKVKKSKGHVPPKKIVKENLTEQDLKKIEKKMKRKIRQKEKRKKAKAELRKQKEEEEQRKLGSEKSVNVSSVTQSSENDSKIVNKPKFTRKNEDNKSKFEKLNGHYNKSEKILTKQRDNKEHSRKKPPLPTKMFINGKEVEIDYVDGFPVKKEDALRLKKLRKEMISKGLPRSEINIALKLERRRAEKAFSREKKKVCFNCRKSGHNLSECPDLEKDQVSQIGTGVCFKCGSTEHTHFECKVVRTQDFKYAHCFICNEQGHIARQCPDNSRGLYPKGGSCKVCGDVTHLKKDCPKYQAQQQHLQNSFNVESISDKPDDLGDTYNSSSFRVHDKKPNKIIKF